VDDALDVWAVHGVGGTWGAIATGLFATVAINSAGANGLFFGNPAQLLTQAIAVGATWLYAAVATFVIVKVIDMTIGMRVKGDEESLGLDRSQHGEIAYQLD
jgi:Amt family ammonium transporter